MKKIKVNNKEYNIKCDNKMCGDCIFKPVMSECKCKLFDLILDHLVSGYSINSGWKRCTECVNAEI